MGQKMPPCNLDAEESVLSACILDPETVETAVRELDYRDFFRPQHQLVFRAISCLARRGRPVDFITVAELLEKEGVLEDAGGKIALLNLCDNTFSLMNAPCHIGIVKRTAAQRRLVRAAQEIEIMASEPQDDFSEVRRRALDLINAAVSESGPERARSQDRARDGKREAAATRP